jgi:tRNA nucleotidyltransferase (CCA-adding enzyme)
LTRINNIHKLLNALEEVLKEKDCFTLKDLDINGNDLISIGIKQGKEIGNILNTLLDKVINEELENKKEVLFEYVGKKFI